MMKRDPRGSRSGADPSVVEELVNGFAHEVKNSLASMKGALKTLKEKMAQEDPNRTVVEQVYDQLGSINKTVLDLIDFTRLSLPEASLADLNIVIKEALDSVMSDCQRHVVKVEEHLSSNLPEVNIDATQIERAFLYLFLDMLKAMPNGGKLGVRSSVDSEGDILVEIEDTGVSIPEIHMERLFKPFFSTRGRGAGTGLALAKRILDQNGGLIEAKARGEEGLTFRVVFPLP